MPNSTKTVRSKIERDFTNHPPTQLVQDEMEEVRKKYKAVASVLHGMGESRERSLALTNLEQSLMWAIAHLARTSYDNTLNGD